MVVQQLSQLGFEFSGHWRHWPARWQRTGRHHQARPAGHTQCSAESDERSSMGQARPGFRHKNSIPDHQQGLKGEGLQCRAGGSSPISRSSSSSKVRSAACKTRHARWPPHARSGRTHQKSTGWGSSRASSLSSSSLR